VRVGDKLSKTVDFLLTRKKQRMITQSFLIKAITNNCRLRVINIDKSVSNAAAIKVYKRRCFSTIKIRQCKYLNNILEQDHRFIKWHIQNGLVFQSFESAKRTLSGIEVIHILRKNQMIRPVIFIFKLLCKLAG
jgi:putative transposase